MDTLRPERETYSNEVSGYALAKNNKHINGDIPDTKKRHPFKCYNEGRSNGRPRCAQGGTSARNANGEMRKTNTSPIVPNF